MIRIHRFVPMAAIAVIASTMSFPATHLASAQEATAKPETSPIDRVPALRAKQNAADTGSGDRVFGGMEAEPGEWPFQVALLASDRLDDSPQSQSSAQFCGGSLIAPNWVLTAAHCLSREDGPAAPDTVTVLTEATNLTEGKRFKAAEVFVHEGYSTMTLDNDIALIRLAEPASAKPINIAKESMKDEGKSTVIGWGMMEDGTFPNDLMEAELELVPNSACNTGIKEIYARDLGFALRELSTRMRYNDAAVAEATTAISKYMADPLTGNMICAGTQTGARDACNGDSGGPLFVSGADGLTQVGIVSWGEGPFDATSACGHKNAYGVYTRLGNYAGWIEDQMKKPAPESVNPPVTQKPGTISKPAKP